MNSPYTRPFEIPRFLQRALISQNFSFSPRSSSQISNQKAKALNPKMGGGGGGESGIVEAVRNRNLFLGSIAIGAFGGEKFSSGLFWVGRF